MLYNIQLRDSSDKLFKDSSGTSISNSRISFDDSEEDSNLIEMICKDTADIYQSITPDGTKINISVLSFNNISNTYMCMYSYYHEEKRFIKH